MAFTVDDAHYDIIDVTAETWDELLGQVREDLVEWLNREPADDDKARLLSVYTEGRFRAWDCPRCKDRGGTTRVFCADVKDDEWSHFPGSRNQDFSYFGDGDKYTAEYIKALCDHCRCYN